MNTWPTSCACNDTNRLIDNCAEWLNGFYGNANCDGGKDWVTVASEVPEEILGNTLGKLHNRHDQSTTSEQARAKRNNNGRVGKEPRRRLGAAEPGDCLRCALGYTIIEEHQRRLVELGNQQAILPELNPNIAVNHDDGTHRILWLTRNYWSWQYHINQGSVRVDCFANGSKETAQLRYNQLREAMGIEGHDFGNGIHGNETRSIFKCTDAGGNAGPEQFPGIARNAVTVMSEIFTRLNPYI